ncbi:breast cancer anti-estrogen resistance protein 1-like isoform X2 [Actinia tenebrosa]|uniref:Breast cancer anti-estrogen resistance protein 1-like isoform X2 n=1 Tax=Actinia tenebrosa TaxID=6105 RepID=A0A6P8I1J7_ACTTE|nr:breast cancer anti-estrogen resistance protein 1-like isoform X2 [Actinia tenebrosa]
MQTVLAKALYDNIADNADELTFRKGDVITVLEKDIDGLYGWWLCSLHGRQGIAPGNRLSEIAKEPKPVATSPTLEYADYAVPRPYEENGEDYDVPRSVFSPQDYDFPKADSNRFEYPAELLKDRANSQIDDNIDNIYQEIYDVPVTTPEKKRFPDLIQAPEKLSPPKCSPSPKRGPKSPTKEAPPKTLSKPPRKINDEKSKKGSQPPPRPPKPVSPRSPKPCISEDIYDVPAVMNVYELAHSKTNNNTAKIIEEEKNSGLKNGVADDAKLFVNRESRSSSSSQSSDKSSTALTSPKQLEDTAENIYDVPPSESTTNDIYDVPSAVARGIQNDIQDVGGKIYDTPTKLTMADAETPNENSKADAAKLQPQRNQLTEENSKRSSSGSDSSGVRQLSSGSVGKRESSSSTGSGGKVSSEDDDYVDYQEIYGFSRTKPVNVYDVPVQPTQVPGESATPPAKQTKISILQRINMSAVKGIKLDPPAALQRLTKLEQAVDVTVNKLLSFVTTTWRDVTLLRSKVADIRDVTGKAKVVLRLLTEFGLSTLVNAQKTGNPELTGKLSRAIEPLLETYYSLKLTLQRLDDGGWRAPLERTDNKEDDLDLIMVYIRSVPENSKKLASVIRMAATILYKLPKDPLPPPAETKQKAPVQAPRTDSLEDTGRNTNDKTAEEVVAKIEKFKPVAMEAESSEVNSTTMMVGLIKACVDTNIKPSDKPKLSPETVRRLCGIDNQGSPLRNLNDAKQKDRMEEEVTPKLPPRKPSNTQPPKPPMRQDSTERIRFVRQQSLERFAPEGESKPKEKVPPNPPPKPKLDRKPTMRKSYKNRVKEAKEGEVPNPVKFREHKLFQIGAESPKGKRKCNSDPTELERNTESENHNNNNDTQKGNRVSDSIETTVPGSPVGSKPPLAASRSDLALPNSASGQTSVCPLSSRVEEYSQHLKPDTQIQRSQSFSRTKPPPAKVAFGENGMSQFILSFSDQELLEFYKYEIDAQLFVLNEAMKTLFSSIEDNKPPKIFVSNSKFVVLSAHKFIYIGETLQSKISHDKLSSDITRVTMKLAECVKSLVHSTKVAALQYSAISPMREMATTAAAISEAAIELHKIVKYEVESK